MLSAVNFMDAIYWGQLSHCAHYDLVIGQYNCSHPYMYATISLFSTFLFFSELVFACGTYLWRGELISEDGFYESVSQNHAFEAQSRSSPFSQSPPSADL